MATDFDIRRARDAERANGLKFVIVWTFVGESRYGVYEERIIAETEESALVVLNRTFGSEHARRLLEKAGLKFQLKSAEVAWQESPK